MHSIPTLRAADPMQALVRAAIKRHALSEFVELYRDLYRSPDGFTGWNGHLQRCAYYANPKVIMTAASHGDRVQAMVGAVCLDALVEQAPARFLAPELGEALMRTPHPPITSDILEILPQLHLLLPRGLLFGEDGEPIEALVIKTGELHPDLSDEERERVAAQIRRHGDLPMIPRALEGTTGVMVAALGPTSAYGWVEYVEPEARALRRQIDAEDEIENDSLRSLTETVARLAVNALLIHRHEPELISTDPAPPRQRGAGFGRREKRSPLAPTWIGKSFRHSCTTAVRSQADRERRNPVRAHWRRGHWHTVVHGPERKERRLQWFRPVFVQPA